ncbi:MAG: rod shape-determining protein RodA [Candidatus Latescibacterota bacterium]|nr:MAG: rod shape-determining protein RodA [Candidatus Latescibacterota bacterium]
MRLKGDFDWLVLITASVLCIVGLGLIYSVFHPPQNGYAEPGDNTFFIRQLIWLAIGMVALFAGFIVPFRIFEALAFVFYGVGIVLLVAVLFVKGGPQAQRWIAIGPMRLQPSEFMKIALLFVWARVLSGQRRGSDRSQKVIAALALSVIPFLLILRQPDLGTAMVLFVIIFPVLYWRGIKGYQIFFFLSPLVTILLIIYGEKITSNPWPFGIYIVFIFLVAYWKRSDLKASLSLVVANLGTALIFPFVWQRLKVYQQDRILNFLDPGANRLDEGWQVFQSKIAIGSGGLSGKGFFLGTQKALEFLPAKHTDFIFSVLGEEVGFVGALLVLVLFTVLIVRALILGDKAKSEFASTVCIGIAAYFFFQVFINVAMTTGMAPVTGIPLPFLSYGGSSLVVSCFFVGFLLNCSVRWYEY